MMKVANRKIIHKLTVRFLKAGKIRNIITIIAIALTSIMFTSVFTLGGNMVIAIQEQTMRQVGTSAHGGLKYLTMEQYKNFAESPLIKDISYNRLLGIADNNALKKLQCEIRYAEDKIAKWNFSYPSTGKMPQVGNEIACSTIVLDTLGISHEIGVNFPLEFTVGGRKYTEIFTLSGYWIGDPVMAAQQIWLSKDFVDTVLSENTIPEGDYAGTISVDVWFDNSFDIESKMQNLIAERSYSEDEIQYGINWAYATSDINFDWAVIAIAVLLIALILLSGYLIIYAIFAISITNDIHFYGLLKTIGTTGLQIRKIVRDQALVLSVFGIPIGLFFGYIAGVSLMPLMFNIVSTFFDGKASASPLIFVFAAAFSLLTVFIGCRKPARVAAQVSPVEAVKYSGVSVNGKRKAKKTHKVTPLSMAWANIMREKRKLCVIIMSLSLSLILLNSAVSATRSFDMDAYLSSSIMSDFAVADYSVFGIAQNKNTNGVTADFLREAESHGAEEISNVYYYYLFDYRGEGDASAWQVYGVGRMELESFSDIDYEKLHSGNYAIVSKQIFSYGDNPITVPQIGDTLTLKDNNYNGVPRNFEVIGLIEYYPQYLSERQRYGNSLDVILADNVFLELFGPNLPMQTNINVSAEHIDSFESWLEDYTTIQEPNLKYISRNTLKKEFDGLKTTYLALGGVMAFILALIGVLNFINAIVASIIARRRELAMLQSIGMTGKQLRRMLFFEGIYYTVLTAFFTLTVGFGVSLMIVKVIAGQAWFFKQNITVMPSIFSLMPLLLICATVPLICYKQLIPRSPTLLAEY